MSNVMRSEVSCKNEYWISKNRFYELKYFCRQWGEWHEKLKELDGVVSVPTDISDNTEHGDYTADCAEMRERYISNIELLKRVAVTTDPVLGVYILTGITRQWSYDIMRVRTNIPCGKNTYYHMYRRFMWLLSQRRY